MKPLPLALVAGILLLPLATLALSQQPKPQVAPRGIFSRLTVGQPVEFLSASQGATIRTYEDEMFQATMKDRIEEIGPDYIVIVVRDAQADKDAAEVRLPLNAVMGVVHVKK